MFHNYQAHSLNQLAQQFSEIFKVDSNNPLAPAWIVVQNNEIKEWLSLKFASRRGIAGNFRFIFPSEFLWTLYRLQKEEVPKVLPSDLNAIQWALFNLLTDEPELLDAIPFYDRDDDTPRKRFRFCTQLADNFDQYQVYRPAMMEKWLNGKLVTKNSNERWQSQIWNRLNEKWQFSSKTKDIPRRSEAFFELLNGVDGGVEFLEKVPSQIYVFGLSHAPRPFLEIISKVSKFKDIHYFARISLQNYELPGLNSLIEKWRKPEQEQAELLNQILNENSAEIQKEKLEEPKKPLLPNIEIHSCHNKRRELQVLKDKVLKYLDENPGANPSDVLVIVPDAEAYTGVLETVFSDDQGEPAIPVSRLSRRNRQSAEHTLAELLELLTTPFKATLVLQFMQLEPVKTRFSFSDADLNLIEQWVFDNKIHQGIGEHFNTRYSWQKGLNQLLAGFSMQPEPLEVYKGLVPFPEISSSDDADLAARFSRFLHGLKKAHKELSDLRTPFQWLQYVHGLINKFLGEVRHDEQGNNRLFMLIDKLKEQAAYVESPKPVSFYLLKSWLIAQLESQDSSSGRFGQGVTVSSYIPYRSVPFNFIAVLGMDEAVFPRKAIKPEFDLIYANPQPGDRILKEDDTYLFLETLGAARDYLHISYRGQDQRSDAIKLPSILVQQLLDVLYEDEEKGIVSHSLHPFNQQYFSTEEPVSFSVSNLELAKQMGGKIQSEDGIFIPNDFTITKDDPDKRIHISDIISFFTHPCKYFLEKGLDIRNYEEFNKISDREEFKLKGLERYKLDNFLFQKLSKKESPDKVYRYADAASMIPEGMQGEKVFQKEQESIGALLNELDQIFDKQEEKRSIEISIDVDGIEIFGVIDGIYGDTLVSHRVGERRAKYEAEHWLKHIILLEAGEDISQSIYLSKKDAQVERLTLSSQKIDKNPFRELLKWFNQDKNLLKKFCFFVESSKKYTVRYLDGGVKDTAISAARSKWEDGKFKPFAESTDYFNRVIWRNTDPLSMDAFHENALRFWEPFINAIVEGNDE